MIASDHTPKKGKTKPRVGIQAIPPNNTRKNRAALLQPALFRTCSQIRSESRVFFYRYHTFHLHVWQEDHGLPSRIAEQLRLWRPRICLDRVKRWLDFLGKDTREQIRTIEIELHRDDLTTVETYAGFIDDVHARLSDDATVVYRTVSRARGFAMLFELGRIFQARNPARVLHFEHPNWSLRNNTNVWASTLQDFVYTRTRYRVPGPSLTFGPRLGWFGRKERAGSVSWIDPSLPFAPSARR